ncbi:glutathione S-transferase U7 [Ricinus communis]|uniref:glutathione transferase n=1 Tax=Ricinus communis TaxID=3988 RepID=B9S3A9_RICCO|nr:glutathione S-transferase U7 [Ricinus communis]EEF41891.1 glutathione s-transferase, putative [Ricinus communis]|eukprot:XP_002520478.1 glutathione S-transferase U7 [Ricinus communis]
MSEEVKVFGTWSSPYSRRVEIALKLKGIQYEYIEEDLSNKSDLLLKYNPVHEKIPVLVHNGKPVAESLVILEYIDETWQDNPILPKDPYSRAMARFWTNFVDEKILQTAKKTRTAKAEELEQLHQEIYQDMKLLESELEGKEFFGGEKIGQVDIVAFVILYWFHVMSQGVLQTEFISEEKFPVLHKWMAKLCEIDAIKECLPPRDKHVAYMKARFVSMKSASK